MPIKFIRSLAFVAMVVGATGLRAYGQDHGTAGEKDRERLRQAREQLAYFIDVTESAMRNSNVYTSSIALVYAATSEDGLHEAVDQLSVLIAPIDASEPATRLKSIRMLANADKPFHAFTGTTLKPGFYRAELRQQDKLIGTIVLPVFEGRVTLVSTFAFSARTMAMTMAAPKAANLYNLHNEHARSMEDFDTVEDYRQFTEAQLFTFNYNVTFNQWFRISHDLGFRGARIFRVLDKLEFDDPFFQVLALVRASLETDVSAEKIEAAAERLVTQYPQLADGYVALAYAATLAGDDQKADDFYGQALDRGVPITAWHTRALHAWYVEKGKKAHPNGALIESAGKYAYYRIWSYLD